MLTFRCHCGNPIYFENTTCLNCGRRLGYLFDSALLSALEPAGDDRWLALAGDLFGQHYRMCGNYQRHNVCNGMVAADSEAQWCPACAYNQTIPDLYNPMAATYWSRLEAAKRRLLRGLSQLGLIPPNKSEDPEDGLAFAFLADRSSGVSALPEDPEQVHTGHHGGVITINLAEADDAHREAQRQQMAEPYRTVLGHFRHESGHYFWKRLINGPRMEAFRQHFGDERDNYGAALERYYLQGPEPDWQQRYISAYASSHAWEDWAESWAHYLLMIDTLESAEEAGIARFSGLPFEQWIEEWSRTSIVVNNLNRCMGANDAWPFVLSAAVIDKLAFIDEAIKAQRN